VREVSAQRFAAGRLIEPTCLFAKHFRTFFRDEFDKLLAARQQHFERKTAAGGRVRRQRGGKLRLQRRNFGEEKQRFARGGVAAREQVRSRGSRGG